MKKNKQTNVKTEGEKISKLINKHHQKKKENNTKTQQSAKHNKRMKEQRYNNIVNVKSRLQYA